MFYIISLPFWHQVVFFISINMVLINNIWIMDVPRCGKGSQPPRGILVKGFEEIRTGRTKYFKLQDFLDQSLFTHRGILCKFENVCMLCILTSLRVLRAAESWSKYFPFLFLLFKHFKVNYSLKSRKNV